jgi:hypothetical protein
MVGMAGSQVKERAKRKRRERGRRETRTRREEKERLAKCPEMEILEGLNIP